VRVDDGPWQEARLGDDGGDDAWRQWVYEWDATKGDHRLQVRATDRSGDTQTEEVAPPAPNGATGYHTRRVTVR
jgi:sulfite oxidase